MNTKKTAGQIVLEAAKSLENKPIEMVNVQELGHMMRNPDQFMEMMVAKIAQWRSKYTSDFYIELNLKREKWIDMAGVLQKPRELVNAHLQCPTPAYDQTVYIYHYKKDDVELLWTLPHKEACENYRHFALQVVPEERELLKYVLSYYDGSLLHKVKELNGEKKDAPSVLLSINKE